MNIKKYILIVMIIVLILSLGACIKKENPVELVLEPENIEEAAVVNSNATIIKVTEADFEEKILNSTGVVLVDFWAEWCGPCVALAPILEDVSAETGVTVAKLNVDENPALASAYQINAIPAVYVFVDGQVAKTIIGINPKENYIKVINEYK